MTIDLNKNMVNKNQARKGILIFALLVIPIFAVSQEPGINADLRPEIKSPEVNKFERYTDLPVNMVSGTPQISIPIYTLRYRGMEVPITLEYDASGVKVESIASSVGMNWALNVGGTVSRIVKGAPDEGNPYAYNSSSIDIDGFYQDYGLTKLGSELDNFVEGDPYNGSGSHPKADQFNYWIKDIANGSKDSQPDLFYFSTPQGGAKFVFNNNREVVYTENTDFTIKENFLNNVFVSWKAVSPTGIVYDFGENGINESGYSSQTGEDTNHFKVNSWFLTHISDPFNNGSISIDYIDNAYSDYYANIPFKTSEPCLTWYQNTAVIGECGNGVGPYSDFAGNPYTMTTGGLFPQFMNYQYMENHTRSKLISKITAGKINIDFLYLDRQDLVHELPLKAKYLQGITVSYDGNCIKKFEFDYSYRIAPDFSSGFDTAHHEALRKRLFLDGMREISCDASIQKEHQFLYNDQVLPQRTSYARDKWGYYNGQTGNQSLFPKYSNSEFAHMADRSVDVPSTKAGILEKIIYPTGGSVEFTYEGNESTEPTDYVVADWPAIPEFTLNSQSSQEQYASTTITYDPDKFYKMKVNMIDPMANSGCQGGIVFSITSVVGPSGTRSYSYEDLVTRNCYNDGSSYNCTTIVEIPMDGYYFQDGAGDYLVEVFGYKEGVGNNAPVCLAATVQLYKTERFPTYEIGGLRIQKITHKDADGSIAKEMTYTYQNPKVIYNPSPVHRAEYDYSLMYDNLIGILDLGNIDYLRTVSQSIQYSGGSFIEGYYYCMSPGHDPLSIDFMGPHISYGKVIESNGESSTTYTFEPYQSYFELNGFQVSDVYPPNPKRQSILSGSERTRSQYGTISDIYSSTEYDHSRYNTAVVGLNVSGAAGNTTIRPFDQYAVQGQVKRVEREETAEDFGDDEFVTATEYFYQGNGHQMWTRKETTDSKGDLRTVVRSYPDDVTGPTALAKGDAFSAQEYNAISRLKADDLHNVAVPIQSETYKGNKLLSLQRIIYKDWNNNKVFPEINQSAKGDGNLEDKLTYQRFDSSGNPLQASNADDIDISFIWGYDGMYPVARIENATYSDIEALSGFGNNFYLDDGGLTTSQEAALRAMPGALVTTYTYKPLIGVTSITDPKGNTIYYGYDGFNRLETVKDADGNLITDYEYHYTNEPIN